MENKSAGESMGGAANIMMGAIGIHWGVDRAWCGLPGVCRDQC